MQQNQVSLTPEQMQQISQLPPEQQIQIYEQLAAQRGDSTNYNQFLASRGMQPEQQDASMGGASSAVSGYLSKQGSDYLLKQLGWGGTEAASAAPAATAAPIGLVTEGLGTGIPGLQGGTALIGGQVGYPGLQGGQALVGGQIAPAAVSGWDMANIGMTGNYLLPAAGAIGAIDVLGNDYGPGRGALQGAASGAAIGSYFGVPGALIGGGIGGAIGLGKGLMKHESTADVAKKHTKSLVGQSDDATWQAYLRGMRDQHTPDPTKPFAGGKYSTWDEYQKAGLDASDLTGVYGNLKAFGPEWAKLSFDQRKAVTQKLIDANLYKNKKGEVEITDEAKARDIFKNVSEQGFKSSETSNNTAKESKKMNGSYPWQSADPRVAKIWTQDESGNWMLPSALSSGPALSGAALPASMPGYAPNASALNPNAAMNGQQMPWANRVGLPMGQINIPRARKDGKARVNSDLPLIMENLPGLDAASLQYQQMPQQGLMNMGGMSGIRIPRVNANPTAIGESLGGPTRPSGKSSPQQQSSSRSKTRSPGIALDGSRIKY